MHTQSLFAPWRTGRVSGCVSDASPEIKACNYWNLKPIHNKNKNNTIVSLYIICKTIHSSTSLEINIFLKKHKLSQVCPNFSLVYCNLHKLIMTMSEVVFVDLSFIFWNSSQNKIKKTLRNYIVLKENESFFSRPLTLLALFAIIVFRLIYIFMTFYSHFLSLWGENI